MLFNFNRLLTKTFGNCFINIFIEINEKEILKCDEMNINDIKNGIQIVF